MKSQQENNSKYTSSTPFTSILSPEDYSGNCNHCPNGNIQFRFSCNNTLSSSFHSSFLQDINPKYFTSFSQNNDYIITLPPFINDKILQDFIFISKNGIGEYEDDLSPNMKHIFLLIKVSEYFQCEKISIELLTLVIKTYKSFLVGDIAFLFLLISYRKLTHCSSLKKECDNLWFELFYICLEKIGNNIQIITNNYNTILKRYFDKKIIEEIVNKAFEFLILGNFILIQGDTVSGSNNTLGCEVEEENPNTYDDSNNCSNLDLNDKNGHKSNFISLKEVEKLLNIISDLRNQNNFFDLMNNEYRIINSNDTIQELSQMPVPTLMIRLPKSVDNNYYEEYPIDINLNGKQIMFSIWYKNLDDTLYISIKLSGDNNDEKLCFKMFTVLTVVKLTNESNEILNSSGNQENINYLSNNKNMYTIFKLSNYTKVINEYSNVPANGVNVNKYLLVKIYFKLCYIHSVLASFLLKNFETLSKEENIRKLPKNIFWLILKNKYINVKSENEIVKALNLWLDDDLNVKEDISEILNYIQWERVDRPFLFEFLIKYYNLFTNKEEVANIISNNCGTNFENVFQWLFEASKKINYPKLIRDVNQRHAFEFINTIDNIKKEYSKKEESSNTNTMNIITKNVKKEKNGGNNNVQSGITSSFFNSSINNINTNALNSNNASNKNTISLNLKDAFIKNLLIKKENKKQIVNQNANNNNGHLKPKKMKRIEKVSQPHKDRNQQYNYFTLSKSNSFSINKKRNEINSKNKANSYFYGNNTIESIPSNSNSKLVKSKTMQTNK